jgi:tRNA(Arg) A34 adenosine deaminase TadA
MTIKLKNLQYVSSIGQNSNLTKLHGAGVYKSGKIICTGYNHDRTCYYKNVMCSTHAEIDVCRKLINNYYKIYDKNVYNIRRKMKKLTLYVSRNDINILSIPCTDCMNQLYKIGIQKIIYSSGNENIYEVIKSNDIDKTRKSPVNLKMCKYTKINNMIIK